MQNLFHSVKNNMKWNGEVSQLQSSSVENIIVSISVLINKS